MKINSTSENRRASDVLYDEISTSRNSIRRENAHLLKIACDQMEKDGVTISATEAVRRCGVNGPAYSTVSNQGSRLGEYVRLRVLEQGTKLSPKRGADYSIAGTISDTVLQAQVLDMESNARWLLKENNGLRTLLKSLSPGVEIDKLLSKGGARATAKTNENKLAGNQSSGPELQGTLLKLMDHLVGSRQYRESRGRLTINSKIVLDAKSLETYQQATGLTADEWRRRYGDSIEQE